MLKSIKITNFCSIGKEQELLLDISGKEVLDNFVAEFQKYNVNLVNCLIGHNAHGKTTVLKAISFIFWLMGDSYISMEDGEHLPFEPHAFHKDKPTQIEIEFSNGDDLYQYKIELNTKSITKEFFGKKKVRGFTRIFEYVRNESDWVFQSKIPNLNKGDLNRFKRQKNRSVLSSLINTGYLQDFLFIKNCKSNVSNMGHFIQHPVMAFFDISKSLYEDSDLQRMALNFLTSIDIGISGFEFSEAVRVKDGKKIEDSDKKPILECVHESSKGKFSLPLIEESSGTRHGLHLLTMIAPILKTGGVIVLDEIDSGLHPYVVKKVISLFENKETNPLRAQLFFSTHQHLLLNDRTKTQIFIAEKSNKAFETEVFRLDDIEGIRNDENYFSKYLAGEYGGIPDINWART